MPRSIATIWLRCKSKPKPTDTFAAPPIQTARFRTATRRVTARQAATNACDLVASIVTGMGKAER
jgi:hypothetical protein